MNLFMQVATTITQGIVDVIRIPFTILRAISLATRWVLNHWTVMKTRDTWGL